MQAVDRFDFARGNKFSTYATWAIFSEFARLRPEGSAAATGRSHCTKDSLAAPDSGSDEHEHG